MDHAKLDYVRDTGNLHEAEQTVFEDGIDRPKGFIRNVHLKDGQLIDGKMAWQHYGTGMTDIRGQVAALKSIDCSGTLVLQAARIPHEKGDFEASLAYLKSVL